jgi:hypothetical protein
MIIEASNEFAFKTWFKSQASRKSSSCISNLLTKGPPHTYTKDKKLFMVTAWFELCTKVLFLQMWETPDSNPGLQFLMMKALFGPKFETL